MTDWLTHWLTDWQTDWLTDWLGDWVTNWLNYWLIEWLINQLTWWTDWLTDSTYGWIDKCTNELTNWLIVNKMEMGQGPKKLIDWLLDTSITGRFDFFFLVATTSCHHGASKCTVWRTNATFRSHWWEHSVTSQEST